MDPFVPIPFDAIPVMLELADLKQGENLVDLGSGDGRILVEAAGRFGAKALGVEIREFLVRESRKRIRQAGLGELAKVSRRKFKDADLRGADVVTRYLSSYAMGLIEGKLRRELGERARVVTFDFEMFAWRAHRAVHFTPKGWKKSHPVYLYDRSSMLRGSREVVGPSKGAESRRSGRGVLQV